MKGRNSQVARIVRIIMWLENSKFGLTTKEIHERLKEFSIEASLRTIYRDIEAIQQSGVPLAEDDVIDLNQTTRWFLKKEDYLKKSSRLTDREYLALLFARYSLLPSIQKDLQTVYENTLNFAEIQLTLKEKNHLNEIKSVVVFDPDFVPDFYMNLQFIEEMILACLEEIEVNIGGRFFMPHKILFQNKKISILDQNKKLHVINALSKNQV